MNKPHTIVDEIEQEAEAIIDRAWKLANKEMDLDAMDARTRGIIYMAFIIGIVTSNAGMLSIPPARHGALRHALVRLGPKKAKEWQETYGAATRANSRQLEGSTQTEQKAE